MQSMVAVIATRSGLGAADGQFPFIQVPRHINRGFMMRHFKKCIPMTVLAICSATTQAEDFFVSGGVGTLGLGIEIGRGLNDSVDMRGGLNYANISRSMTESEIRYNADLKLNTISLLGDWYPMGNGFRVTAGPMINNNQLDMKAKLSGTLDIGGTVYNGADLGDVRSKVDFRDVVPYLGIGWSSKPSSGGLSFTADLGVLHVGSPRVRLSGNCNAGTPICDDFASDLRAEERELRKELKDFRWWPVAAVGVRYQF